jgi:hypothetical protein
MPTIPEAEARGLLSQRLICEGAIDWIELNDGETVEIAAGLMDEAGLKTGLLVSLSFKAGRGTVGPRYTFSVFRMNSYGTDRVYQLCVSRVAKRDKSKHRQPHEHFGSRRNDGSVGWYDWEYEDVLARFCAQTNIAFAPAPPAPGRTTKGWRCREHSCQYVCRQLPGL